MNDASCWNAYFAGRKAALRSAIGAAYEGLLFEYSKKPHLLHKVRNQAKVHEVRNLIMCYHAVQALDDGNKYSHPQHSAKPNDDSSHQKRVSRPYNRSLQPSQKRMQRIRCLMVWKGDSNDKKGSYKHGIEEAQEYGTPAHASMLRVSPGNRVRGLRVRYECPLKLVGLKCKGPKGPEEREIA